MRGRASRPWALRWGPLVVAVLATIVLWTLVDRWWPLLPLGYGPRWPWLVLPILPLLAGGSLRARLFPALLTAIVVLWGLLGFRVGIGRPAGDTPTLRLIVFNAGVRETAMHAIADVARRWQADAMVIVECPRRAAAPIPGFRLAIEGELCVWSSVGTTPEITPAPRDTDAIGWSGTIAVVTLPGSGLAPLGVVHLRSVRNELTEFLDLSELLGEADSMEVRRSKRIAGSIYASRWLRGLPSPPELVVGDFNLVVESPRFRADWGHWRDAFEAIGTGTGFTWHSRWYGLRIDHVLHDEHWRPTSFEVGPSYGSDHRPLLVELARQP